MLDLDKPDGEGELDREGEPDGEDPAKEVEG